jgi:hypothetical protein
MERVSSEFSWTSRLTVQARKPPASGNDTGQTAGPLGDNWCLGCGVLLEISSPRIRTRSGNRQNLAQSFPPISNENYKKIAVILIDNLHRFLGAVLHPRPSTPLPRQGWCNLRRKMKCDLSPKITHPCSFGIVLSDKICYRTHRLVEGRVFRKYFSISLPEMP